MVAVVTVVICALHEYKILNPLFHHFLYVSVDDEKLQNLDFEATEGGDDFEEEDENEYMVIAQQEANRMVESIYDKVDEEEEEDEYGVYDFTTRNSAERELIWVQSIHLRKLNIIQDKYNKPMRELLSERDHQLIFGFLEEYIDFEKRMFQRLHPTK